MEANQPNYIRVKEPCPECKEVKLLKEYWGKKLATNYASYRYHCTNVRCTYIEIKTEKVNEDGQVWQARLLDNIRW